MAQPDVPSRAQVLAEIDDLIAARRVTDLWFLRADYHPRTAEERLRLLRCIELHGDVDSFRRAASLRRWLLRPSSAESAGS